MGSASSKQETAAEDAQHAAAKAAKAEFKAREARRKAECVAKGVKFTRGKFVPPGYYDVKPGDWPVKQRDTSAQSAGSYYGQPMQTREAMESQYGAEVSLQPEERVTMAGGRLYPQIAAQARPQPQMVYQPQQHGAQQQYSGQPAYRVVELRDIEYGESYTPWQSGGAAAKERRETGPVESWQRHKAELLQRKKEVDEHLRELSSHQHEHAARFRDITARERQLRLAEEEEMERRAEIRRQRAEIKHREQQLKEREAAREYYLNEERQAEQEAQKYRKTAATAERSKLEIMEAQKRELETEMQRERQYASQTKALGDAEAARMEKLRVAEANLKAQQANMDKELRQLRIREHEHQQKVERLSMRERELLEEERRVRAEQAAKEKRAAEATDRNYQHEKAVVEAEFAALQKRREALDKAEKDSQEHQNKLHREIQEAEKERNKTRSETEKAAMEREKAVGQKPVVSARDLRESVQSAFQCPESQHPDQGSTQPTQQTHRPGETSFAEKARRGWEHVKEKVTGSSESTDVGHNVPGASVKETAGKAEREREHARVSKFTTGSPAVEPMSTQSQQRVTQHEDSSSARAHSTREIHVRREIES